MEINQKQQCQFDNGQSEATLEGQKEPEGNEVAPGVPVVRSNTPRPLSFEAMALASAQAQRIASAEPVPVFPERAPSAPPLPEEIGESEENSATSTVAEVALASRPKPLMEEQEFLWLFEYGLEMDSAILNSPERLDGLALLYGPAVLKGYDIMLADMGPHSGYGGEERTIVTIVPAPEPGAEVWGVLYRIPRRVAERNGDEPSLLDTVHDAQGSQGLFRAAHLTVHETYRNREIACRTYLVTDAARQWLYPLALTQGRGDALLVQRLVAIAKKQKLPEKYLSKYSSLLAPPNLAAPHSDVGQPMAALRAEQDTDPLPVLKAKGEEPSASSAGTRVERKTSPIPVQNRWLVVFAIYLVCLLLIVLTFAVLQGMGLGSAVLTTSFSLLGVPWLVLIYGLLGGCISSIVTLGRSRLLNPPIFIIITWFTRPYIGAALALFSYLFLTSGLFQFDGSYGAHRALLLLAGALAGLCEGWIFVRRR